jgi:hypothetical protein
MDPSRMKCSIGQRSRTFLPGVLFRTLRGTRKALRGDRSGRGPL